MRSSTSLIARLHSTATQPTIPNLTQWEQNLFRFLRRVASSSHETPSVELRVAGGWVRDKLLSRQTGDIDIALHNTTGYQFANTVYTYAERVSSPMTLDGAPQHGCAEHVPNVSGIATIEPNPAMSRHLQTATVRVDGNDLDFVQLRTETYAQSADHRIPSAVAPGTPLQDAYRRDFTINALFYNLHTLSVEDYTGNGLRDLSSGLIRTPLPPKATLEDDPLRSLRALRFACRLGFQLDPSLEAALSAPQVRHALARKVSRERIGIEMLQILESPDAVRGLEMLTKYQLVDPVFLNTFKSSQHGSAEDLYKEGISNVRQATQLIEDSIHVLSKSDVDEFQKYGRLVLILATLAGDRTRTNLMIRDAFRKNRRLRQNVSFVIALSDRLAHLVKVWRGAVDSDGIRRKEKDVWIDIAELVREAGEKLWISVMMLCTIKMNDSTLLEELLNSGICCDICRETPIVNGKRLQVELDLQPGPIVGRAIGELLRIQLWNYRTQPGTDFKYQQSNSKLTPEFCIDILRENRYLFEDA